MVTALTHTRRALILDGARLARNIHPAALVAVPMLAMTISSSTEALEVRRGTLLTVPADEVIDDTLIVVGETLTVEGTINGDLVALVRRVTVRGQINGDLLSAAENINIQGSVGGNVVAFGRSVELGEARVIRNLYAFGADVSIGRGAHVSNNAVTFGNTVNLAGEIGLDWLSFARALRVSGNVGRHLEARGETVTLLPAATIGGNLTAHVEEGGLRTAPAATVEGSIETPVSDRPEPRSRYLDVSFYVWQVLRIGIAFLAGLLLLWLVPAWRTLPLGGGRALTAAGIGLATAVALPIASIILLITIIGLPLGLLGLALWGLGLYFGKIVVAQQIGRALFQAPHGLPHHAATLLVGLVIVVIAINVPLLGLPANIVLTLLGLGLMTMHFVSLSDRGNRMMGMREYEASEPR
jgi:hypothetical protein